MTTYQGVAAVTQTLAHLTSTAIQRAVPEARVTLERPESPPAVSRGEPRLNIYLVQVEFAPTMRSNDLPTRAADGDLVGVPQVPLNLRYLFSYFGGPIKTHLMLGAIEVALREQPDLDPALIKEALAPHPALHGSGLENQHPGVRITPSSASLEELSRFWSGFFQMPYTLSTMHEASAVILTSALPPTVAPPVHGGGPPQATAGLPPQLDPLPTVAHDATVPVSGRGVAAGHFAGLPGGLWAEIKPAADGLAFKLPKGVGAGPQPVQLGQQTTAGPRPIPGSGAQLLSVRPAIVSVGFDRDGRGDPVVNLTVAPPVAQELALLMVAMRPTGTASPASTRVTTTPPAPATKLTLRPPELPSGPYLVIVEVGGVQSMPVYNQGRYAGPSVVVA